MIDTERFQGALRREIQVITLLRAVVSEADFSATDHAAVLHVLKRRAERAGVPIEHMARSYVAGFKVKPDARLRWVSALDPRCEKPHSWPKRLDWERYRPQCAEAVARIRAFLDGELYDPCEGKADHWGARTGIDLARAQRAGWKRLSCSARTANLFWRERGSK